MSAEETSLSDIEGRSDGPRRGQRRIKMLAVDLGLSDLKVGQQLTRTGEHSQNKIIYINGDRIGAYNMLRDLDREISYEEDYGFSPMTLEQLLEVETDPLRQLALRILMGDPMALDAARDVLKC